MKKIGIVSCYFQHNYGSMLQAYALQKFLDKNFILNETICVDGLMKEIKKRKVKYFLKHILSPTVIKDKWGYFVLAFEKKIKPELRNNIYIRSQKFDSFSKEKFHLSRGYGSFDELTEGVKNYSAVLLGSDQLWLPSNIEADYYTLNFVPKEILKISYATSFGVNVLPFSQKNAAKKFLPKIDFLSVREHTGKKMIQKLINKDVPVVCDPTLLLTGHEWMNECKENYMENGKYIFCYFLGKNPLSRQTAILLKNKTGLKIIALQQIDIYIKNDEKYADKVLYEIDPFDFVYLIANAEFICTDSFHGTVFSILYEKKFFTFRRFNKKTKMSTNSRLDSLLEILALRNRIIEHKMQIKDVYREVIDYKLVNQKLEEFRESSILYLMSALGGIKDDTHNR